MEYTIKSLDSSAQITCIPPTGSIMAYLGYSDPSGWVIMDGVVRDNNSDGKYNNLISMQIGSGIVNGNYTPPNYKAAFLRGAGAVNGYNGGAVRQQNMHQLLNHTHGLYYKKSGWAQYTDQQFALIYFGSATLEQTGGDTDGKKVQTGFTKTDGSGNETYPYNYTVNWILKL
jgi:hypothetical protein